MIGRSIAHYTVTDRLGVGGMGEVYRARDSKLHREVALKVLPPGLAQDPDHMARFAREAQVLATLNHPNIASVYGLEEGQGVTALVMELIPGETLADRIERGPLSVEEAARIGVQIAQALEEAHEHGIIHRDLKPANVKITPDGRVKVLDFGLAKALEGSSSGVGLTNSPTVSLAATQAGVILGTAGYMAPEQAAAQRTDRRADIWSFGVVLLEMLTGRRTFTGETVAHILAAVLHGSPDLGGIPESVPPRIKELLRRCLAKSIKARLQAIGDARIVLEEYLADPASFEEKPAAAVAAAAAPRARMVPWAIAAGAILVAIAVALFPLRPERVEPRRPVRLRAQAGDDSLFLGVGSSAALSRDGRRLATVLGEGEARTLYVRELGQLANTLLPGTDVAYSAFFSPDGQWIGFATPRELKKISISGGTPLTLAPVNRPRGASWGDGDLIAVAPNPSSGLFTMPAAGGALQELTQLDQTRNEFSHRWPQVLPGGKAVLFTVLATDTGDVGSIDVVEIATGERTTVHRGGNVAKYLASGHLVYVNEGTLFAVPFDLEARRITSTPAPVVQGVAAAGGGAHYDVADDGTLVYLEGQAGTPRYELALVDRNGATSPFTSEKLTYVEPRFSPDGRRLAVEILDGTSSDSWVYDLERRTKTRLTFSEGSDSAPVWSPDGSWIVFASEREGGVVLVRKASDGSGDEEELTETSEGKYASSWSPDGRHILFTGINPQTGNDLMLLPLEGDRTPVPYLSTTTSEAEGAFSPDGRYVAYDSEESGRREVYVRPFPMRGGKWQISVEGGMQPRWDRSGKRLYFRAGGAVMGVDIDLSGDAVRAGTPTKHFEGAFVQASFGGNTYADWDVAPDGQRFVMLQGEGGQPIADHLVIVFDWFEELSGLFAGR